MVVYAVVVPEAANDVQSAGSIFCGCIPSVMSETVGMECPWRVEDPVLLKLKAMEHEWVVESCPALSTSRRASEDERAGELRTFTFFGLA